MNPLEFLMAQFAQSGVDPSFLNKAPAGPPDSEIEMQGPGPAMPPAQSPSWNPMEDARNSAPAQWLRDLLKGAPDPMADPEGGKLAADVKSGFDKMQASSALPSREGGAVGSMPDPVGNQTDPAFRSMFSEGQQQPSAARMPVPSRAPAPGPAVGSWETTVKPAAAAGDGFDWGKFLLNTLQGGMAGAATAHGTPRGGGIGALGAGFTAAQQQADKRSQTENASKKLAFDQSLAVAKNTREERGANRADGDSTRKDKEYTLKERDEARKEAKTKVDNQVAVEKLMKVRDDGTVPLAAKMKIQDQLNQYADKVNKNGLMSQTELDGALNKERDRLEKYYGLQGAAPASSDPNEGQKAFNPSTGQRLVRKGGQWVPAQ